MSMTAKQALEASIVATPVSSDQWAYIDYKIEAETRRGMFSVEVPIKDSTDAKVREIMLTLEGRGFRAQIIGALRGMPLVKIVWSPEK